MTPEPGGIDLEALMRDVKKRIEEKKGTVYTDAEIREIAEYPLRPVLDAHEFRSTLLQEFRTHPERWNFRFGKDSLYRSSRGGMGALLERLRAILRPVQKLFWNPNPMIAALSRQSDLNEAYVYLLHNLAEELTRLNLEVQDLRSRHLQLQGRLEFLVRREKALEEMVVYREEPKGSRSPE
ncbi:MAG TPA: hypothetical protein VN083_08140 [Vicinamibacteria bacterium]|nr:hypothetical protein [Vicinamibacteria bacterium]